MSSQGNLSDTGPSSGRNFASPAKLLAMATFILAALAFIYAAFIYIDPVVLILARDGDPSLRRYSYMITDTGRSAWILISAGIPLLVLLGLRTWKTDTSIAAGATLWINRLSLIFLAVAGSGLITAIVKKLAGRARPKYFETLGSLDFNPFYFDVEFASFPSGHATTIFALGTAIALIWPRLKWPAMLVAAGIASTRFLVGEHYVTDVLAGALIGGCFTVIVSKYLSIRQ